MSTSLPAYSTLVMAGIRSLLRRLLVEVAEPVNNNKSELDDKDEAISDGEDQVSRMSVKDIIDEASFE